MKKTIFLVILLFLCLSSCKADDRMVVVDNEEDINKEIEKYFEKGGLFYRYFRNAGYCMVIGYDESLTKVVIPAYVKEKK